MSQESVNVKLLERFIDAYNERDFDSLRALCQPDFEYRGLASQPDEPRVLHGPDEFLRRLNRRDSEFDEFRLDPQEFVEAGDRVIVIFEVTATGKQSGATVSFTEASVWTISDGLVADCEICGTREKAVEVAGSSDPSP